LFADGEELRADTFAERTKALDQFDQDTVVHTGTIRTTQNRLHVMITHIPVSVQLNDVSDLLDGRCICEIVENLFENPVTLKNESAKTAAG
jgi:hypothetical protein